MYMYKYTNICIYIYMYTYTTLMRGRSAPFQVKSSKQKMHPPRCVEHDGYGLGRSLCCSGLHTVCHLG